MKTKRYFIETIQIQMFIVCAIKFYTDGEQRCIDDFF